MGASTKAGDHDRPLKASFVKKRLLIAIMATLCPVVCYISRQNLSLAIVAMVTDANQQVAPTSTEQHQQQQHQQQQQLLPNQTSLIPQSSQLHRQNSFERQNSTKLNSTSGSPEPSTSTVSLFSSTLSGKRSPDDVRADRCPEPSMAASGTADGSEEPIKSYGPKYDWSLEEQNVIFEAFFWTYVLCQIPAARLAETIGAKWVLATAGIGSCLLSLAAPWAASLSVYALALVRALMGICQTALYPACYVLYSHWLPPIERSQALPILCVGAYVGSIISSTSSGYFIQEPLFGWEYAFYMPSVLCGLWSIIWILVGASEPRQHKSISLEEIDYIESKMEVKRSETGGGGGGESRKDISWPKLFKSQHIWAMIVGFFASNWSFSIVLLLLPRYLSKVLYVSPLDNGFINSVIYILYCIASPIVGSVSAMMIETRPCGISRLNVRKFFQGTALFGQAICFLALPIIGCDTYLVSAMLFLQIVLFSLVNGGEVQLPTELSPDFSGTIYAIGNCVGSSTGFLVPRVHSWLVDDVSSRNQWDQYFYLAALISALGGLIFVIFGRNDMQDFSKDINESQLDICKSSRGKSFSLESQNSVAKRRQQPSLDCRSWKQRRDLETAQY